MANLDSARDVVLAVDIVLAMWFYRLRWYGLSSTAATCVVVSLIV